MKITKTNGLKIKSMLKTGGLGGSNHNRVVKTNGLKVTSTLRAGGLGGSNHNRSLDV